MAPELVHLIASTYPMPLDSTVLTDELASQDTSFCTTVRGGIGMDLHHAGPATLGPYSLFFNDHSICEKRHA